MEKCENCGGEGLIHQGDSIKFTCSVCMGTGTSDALPLKAEEEERDLPEAEEKEEVPEESFLGGASEE